MTTGELIRILSNYCPDTPVEALDGNLLTSPISVAMYGDENTLYDEINDGEGGHPDTLYLLTD